MLLQITDVTCEVPLQSPLLSSAITPSNLTLYQLFSSPVPGISVVPAMASCLPAGGHDSKCPSTSARSHPPCLSLWSPFFIHALPHPACRHSTLPSFLATSRTPLTALSFILPSHTSHPPRSRPCCWYSRAWEQTVSHHQQKMPMAPLHQRSPSCSLRWSRDDRVGAETTSIGASPAKVAAACWQWVHLRCMWYVPSSTLWWHWEWASPQSPWQHQQTSFSSLHRLFLPTQVPFHGAWEVLLSQSRVPSKSHVGGVLPKHSVAAVLQITA